MAAPVVAAWLVTLPTLAKIGAARARSEREGVGEVGALVDEARRSRRPRRRATTTVRRRARTTSAGSRAAGDASSMAGIQRPREGASTPPGRSRRSAPRGPMAPPRHAPRPLVVSRLAGCPEPLDPTTDLPPLPAACALTPRAPARCLRVAELDARLAARGDAARRRGDGSPGSPSDRLHDARAVSPATTTTTADSAPCANSASKRLARRGVLLSPRVRFTAPTASPVAASRAAPRLARQTSSHLRARSVLPLDGARRSGSSRAIATPPSLVGMAQSSGRRAASAARPCRHGPPRHLPTEDVTDTRDRSASSADDGERPRALGRRARGLPARAAAPAALVGLQEHVAEVLMWQGKLEESRLMARRPRRAHGRPGVRQRAAGIAERQRKPDDRGASSRRPREGYEARLRILPKTTAGTRSSSSW